MIKIDGRRVEHDGNMLELSRDVMIAMITLFDILQRDTSRETAEGMMREMAEQVINVTGEGEPFEHVADIVKI